MFLKKNKEDSTSPVRSTILEKRMQAAFQDIVDQQNTYFNDKLSELEPILRKYIKEEVKDQIDLMKSNGEL